MPCWASEPITFCQLYVVASSFAQSISMAKMALVASLIVTPSRSFASHSVSGIFAPEVVPFQVKTTSLSCGMDARSGISP